MTYPIPELDARYQRAARCGGREMVSALASFDVLNDNIPPWISIEWYFKRYYRHPSIVALEERWENLEDRGPRQGD